MEPHVSIVIPVFNQLPLTQKCLEALAATTVLERCEIIVVDDASTDATPLFLQALAAESAAVRAVTNPANMGFARSCNAGARKARGRYIVFLNNDTEPQAGWLAPLERMLEQSPDVGMVGPKLVHPDGTIQHCGKVWGETDSPISQPHHIYYRYPSDHPAVNKTREFAMLTGACIMVRREEFLAIGGFDEGYENGWEDDDLCYRYREQGQRIYYCPASVVVHYESISLAAEVRQAERTLNLIRHKKAQGCESGDDAFEEELVSFIERKLLGVRERFHRNRSRFMGRWGAVVERDDYRYYQEDGLAAKPPSECVTFESKACPAAQGTNQVTVIIPVFNRLDLTKACIASLVNTPTTIAFELIIVDNNSTDGTREFLATLPSVRVISNTVNTGFAHACNMAAAVATTGFLLFLNNDTVVTPNWLEMLVETIRQPEIGVVGCKLLYPDGLIQHGGMSLIGGLPDHTYRFCRSDHPDADMVRELDMVTGACFMTPRELYLNLDGFDETYVNGVEDVDYCLRVREAGYKVVYQPRAVVFHYEGQSEGRFDHVSENIEKFSARWHGRFDGSGRFVCSARPSYLRSDKSCLVDRRPVVVWEGSQFVRHSLALVNRELCLKLLELDVRLSIIPYEPDEFDPSEDARFSRLAACVNKQVGTPDVHVRHQWPPDLTPPPQGHWVMIQPWEFGSLPASWIPVMSKQVDEIWVPSSYVRECYINSGIPAEIVTVIPNGVNMERFRPDAPPLKLKTKKSFKFLFVGGTIKRKGIDILVNSYLKTFTARDDVCLVVKDMGSETFYSGRSLGHVIDGLQEDPDRPEIEYIDRMLSEEEMAGMFTACNCLAHPYRGEGFGLPIAEAMASGLPVIVTGFGAALDFCSDESAFLLPARVKHFTEKHVDGMETVDWPWLAEPDAASLQIMLRYVFEHEDEARRKAATALERIRSYSWENAAGKVVERMRLISGRPLRRTMMQQMPRQKDENARLPMYQDIAGKAGSPDVSIVILTYNQLECTKQCVESITRHTPESHEIIFVDNGSTDGSAAWLQEIVDANPRYRLIRNDTNLGFPKGCNQGIEAARGSYILLLNNDTIVTPSWLAGLLECFAAPDTGIVGPITNRISGIQQWPWCGYHSLDELDSFSEEFRKSHRYRRIRCRRIVGFCMLFRRELIDATGLLDEQFGSGNMEDDDLCLRSALEGYNNVIAGDVFIHHHGSASFRGNNISYDQAMPANLRLFQAKWSKTISDPELAKKVVRLKTIEKAMDLTRRGKPNQAVEAILQDGISLVPEETAYYHVMASIFMEAGMFRDALDVLGESPLEGEDIEGLLLQGACNLELGEMDKATRLVDTILRLDSHNARAICLKGRIFLGLGKRQEGEELLRLAHSIDPACVDILLALGRFYQSLGNPDAIDCFKRAFIADPSSVAAAGHYAESMHSPEQLRDGLALYREAMLLYPVNRDVQFTFISILLRLELHAEAMGEAERALVEYGVGDEGFLAAALAVRERVGPMMVTPERHASGCSVSLCMIVKNEEVNLPKCLCSLKPLVDEMIVVDTGSTDRSREVAAIFGARVIESPWQGDYALARNVSLEQASGNWNLVMDADEVISKLDYEAFRRLVDEHAGKMAAFTITTRNYSNRLDREGWRPNDGFYGSVEAGGGWVPSDKVRLFPNDPRIRFSNPVHEMVEPSLERLNMACIDVDNVWVHHYGYLDESRQKKKLEQYYLLGRKKLEESGGEPKAVCELAIQAAEIGRFEEAFDLWQRVLAIDPVSWLAWFNLGSVCLRLGRFEEARKASRRATELKENFLEAVSNLAFAELCTGSPETAEELITDSLQRNADYPFLELMLAIIKCCRGLESEARALFTRLREGHIDFSVFLEEVAGKLEMAGRRDQADRLRRMSL